MNVPRASRTALYSCILLALSACVAPGTGPDLAERTYAELADLPPPPLSIPDYVSEALANNSSLPGLSAADAERFNVSVQAMPAQAFYMGLMADAGVNVVTHPDVEGNISLELKNVTVNEVLDVVREVYGYEYRQQGGIYTIYPHKLRTEVFPVNYLDVTRVGVSDTSVSIGEITSSGGRGASGGQGGASQGGGQGSNMLSMAGGKDDGVRSGPGITPGSRVQTLNRTDFWPKVEASVAAIVGVEQPGRNVIVNAQAGLVVVTGMPAELSAVREFLYQSESSAKRQVVLEAKILEVRLNEGFESGINWNAIQGQLQYSNNVVRSEGINIVDVLQSGPEVFASIFKVVDIRELLSLLETQGAVQVLSSPRVSTVNNQKAVIRVGSDEFFVTGISNSTTSSAGATTNSPEVELASFFSGISLDVTPQISEDGQVILHIHPIVSEVTDQQKEIMVGDSRFSLPLALRDIRESDSIVRAQSGQVIVLGGLMQESNRRHDSRRPGLGDVPLLGNLFRGKVRGRTKTELVILLRPVVVGDDTWRQELNRFNSYSGAPDSLRPVR